MISICCILDVLVDHVLCNYPKISAVNSTSILQIDISVYIIV